MRIPALSQTDACKSAALRRTDYLVKWELRTALERVQLYEYYVILMLEASI